MIESYFFIPASHPKLDEKLKSIQSDIIIIDLEDSISDIQYEEALIKLKYIQDKENIYVRPRINKYEEDIESNFKVLLDLGYRNFIMPKFRSLEDLNLVEKCIRNDLSLNDVNIVLLVENPSSLMTLNDILKRSKLSIIGLGFGSQDYCEETNMDHNYDLLKTPRFLISSYASMYNIKAIDIACMNFEDDDIFLRELNDAKTMGFDGKFFIHPRQLHLLDEFERQSIDMLKEAEAVISKYLELDKPAIFSYQGRAIEPPHIKKYMKILNKSNNA